MISINLVIENEEMLQDFKNHWDVKLFLLLKCKSLYEINILGYKGISSVLETEANLYEIEDFSQLNIMRVCIEKSSAEHFMIIPVYATLTSDYLFILRNLGTRVLSIPNDLIIYPVKLDKVKIPSITNTGLSSESIMELEYLNAVYSKRLSKYLNLGYSIYEAIFQTYLGQAFVYGQELLEIKDRRVPRDKTLRPLRLLAIK